MRNLKIQMNTMMMEEDQSLYTQKLETISVVLVVRCGLRSSYGSNDKGVLSLGEGGYVSYTYAFADKGVSFGFTLKR